MWIDWLRWERIERRRFYGARLANDPQVVLAPVVVAKWVNDCNAHIEAERARLLAEQGPEAPRLYREMRAALQRAVEASTPDAWAAAAEAESAYTLHVEERVQATQGEAGR